MRSFLLSRRFLKDRRLPEGKGGPFGAPSALSVYIVLLRKGMSQWFGMGPLCGPGSEGSKGGIRVLKMDGPSAQGFLSLTGPLAPRVVVAADAADYKKGARLRRRLCRRVVEKGS